MKYREAVFTFALQAKIFEGLEKMKDGNFLTFSVPTGELLDKSKGNI